MNSKELRASARKALKDRYWQAFIVCLIVDFFIALVSAFSAILLALAIIIVVAAIVLRPSLKVGLSKYMLDLFDNPEGTEMKPGVKTVFGFMNHSWKCLWLRILMVVKTFLWSLLFLVPGIIASLRYSQALFVLAENPELSAKEAIETSKRIMRNNKWNYCKLHLSFIGWYILCCLTCFVGFAFLAPYVRAAKSAFYLEKKKNDN